MALDQQQTFNWLVEENARLERERDLWMQRAFDLAFEAAKNNPAIRKQIEQERQAATPDPDVLNFVLRGGA